VGLDEVGAVGEHAADGREYDPEDDEGDPQSFASFRITQTPLNSGLRFSKKARTPSSLS
jgi:hypothetical protein